MICTVAPAVIEIARYCIIGSTHEHMLALVQQVESLRVPFLIVFNLTIIGVGTAETRMSFLQRYG